MPTKLISYGLEIVSALFDTLHGGKSHAGVILLNYQPACACNLGRLNNGGEVLQAATYGAEFKIAGLLGFFGFDTDKLVHIVGFFSKEVLEIGLLFLY